MGLIQKLRSFVKLRQPFEPGRLVLTGPLPRDGNLLILLPERAPRITLWLPYIKGVFSHFNGKKWASGSKDYLPFVKFFLPDIELLEVLPSQWEPDEPLRFLLDLNPPPSPLCSNPVTFGAEYRLALDPDLYPYANIIFRIDQEKDEVTQFEAFLQFLGLKVEPGPMVISEEIRTKTWDYLMYRGHSAGNMLVFIEFRKERSLPVHDVLVEMLKGKVTFMGPGDPLSYRSSKEENLIESLLGTLSLSDLYISDQGFFTGLALHFRIPTLLVDSDIKLPHSHHWKAISSKVDREELKETLLQLLKG